MHVAYASRHWAYPPPIASISVNTAVARAFDARDAPTTEFADAARAVLAGLCVAPRTTFDDAARDTVALRPDDDAVDDTGAI